MTQLPFAPNPPITTDLPDFNEKLKVISSFLDINTIYCAVDLKSAEEFLKNPGKKYAVQEIVVPGGPPAFIQNLLQDWNEELKEAIEKLVAEEDFDAIQSKLNSAKEEIQLRQKLNNSNNTFSFKRIFFEVLLDGCSFTLPPQVLEFQEKDRQKIIENFQLINEFYLEIIELINTHLQDHLDKPSFEKKPFKWNSENPHLEIAELGQALLNCRIELQEGKGGSPAKFIKSLYNLFGYDSSLYHAKLQQIRARTEQPSWLHELAKNIESLYNKPKSQTNNRP